MIPRIERITTIAEMAKEAGVSTQQMRRWLLRLHRRHGGDWLIKLNREFTINRSLLKSEHPEFFRPMFPSVTDIENLRLEQKELRRDLNALAARFRELSNELRTRPAREARASTSVNPNRSL